MSMEDKILQRFKRNIIVTMDNITLYNFCKNQSFLSVENLDIINKIIATSLSRNEDIQKLNARVSAYLYMTISKNELNDKKLLNEFANMITQMDMSYYDISSFTYENENNIWELIIPCDELIDCNY